MGLLNIIRRMHFRKRDADPLLPFLSRSQHSPRIRPVSARFQAFSGCQFQGMSSSMRLIL